MGSLKWQAKFLWALNTLVLTAMAPVCLAESTQTVLSKYREDIEQTCIQNAKPADLKIRDTLLQQLKGKFNADSKSASVPEKTVAQHFDSLLDTITAANNGFRFKEGDKFRVQFIRDAATVFVREAKSAKDLNGNRTPSGWFDTFAGMLQQLRDKLALHKGLGGQVAGMISPLFIEVYKASNMDAKGDATANYKDQVATIKRLFPATKLELQEKNGIFAQILEGHATTIFKERTK